MVNNINGAMWHRGSKINKLVTYIHRLSLTVTIFGLFTGFVD